MSNFEHLGLSIEQGVATITLQRTKKANAINGALWAEIGRAFELVDATPKARVALLTGAGKNFTAGIDLQFIGSMVGEAMSLPEGRKQEHMRKQIVQAQQAFTAAELCAKPIIAAVHGACYGAGVDLITACDMRFAADDARFCIKEVDLAIVADVGTLQRLPHIVGQGVARELAFTGREFGAEEARSMGLINRTFTDHDALLAGAGEVAAQIAAKSPIAVRGIKRVMNYCRDHSVTDGLDYVATWNAGMLLSRDGQEAFGAMLEKRTPAFED